MYKTKLHGQIVQHREYSQYFIITANGILALKTANCYVVHLKLTYFKSTIPKEKRKKFVYNRNSFKVVKIDKIDDEIVAILWNFKMLHEELSSSIGSQACVDY